ncbi:rho GTPase activating protein at 19D isoform X6 [Cotesia typhae]|uniref:rho GTPase activating protein at 19D isoform X6 n=1 Tax=Cotesia typhae TaxID=2053667 RepID=UPI003D682D4F
MADDRNTAQGVIAPKHLIGHALPPPPAPFSGHQQQKQDISPPRGPRTLLLRRSENGFGFTLRHFIVYPPESCCMLPGHERTKIEEPMDTIFVKQVRANSPAAEAGLRTGDRVVSVDGVPTRGEQYASVVQRIQQAEPWLRLLVVSKDDDFLQKFFGDTAHNPETNQRPARLRSPDKILQKQRRSMSMIPGPSSRARQSWVCQTLPGSENQGTAGSSYRLREEALKDQAANKMTTSVPNIQRRPLIEARNHESMYGRTDDRSQRRSLPQQQDIIDPMGQAYRSPPDAKFHLYDRTRSESIYSRPSSEQIYDKIKDPIYERVRPDLNTFSKSLDHQYPMSRAEPQVPIYRPGRRIVTRRASEGSGPINDPEGDGGGNGGQAYSNNEGFKSAGDPRSRLSVESRQDSSPLSKDSSISSSYESTSTLTGNECSDDSIMTRLRKSFEQKEEFLRRPSHPIGWLLPDETARINQSQGVIQREFYARPQKLQRQVWPPNEQQSPQNQQQQSGEPTHQPLTRNNTLERAKNNKPSNQNLQRVRGDIVEISNDVVNSNDVVKNGEREGAQAIRDRFYSSLYDTNNQYGKENNFNNYSPGKANSDSPNRNTPNSSPRNTSNNKNTFITTLSRIHENVTQQQQQQQQQQLEQQQQQQQQQQQEQGELRNGTSSLPSSPGPDKKAEKFPVPPQGLQIVSRRAKQFESGRLLSDDDEPTSDRTNLYKSELSRLSNKRSVPNVAVRKREFESKAEFHDGRRIAANRESKSLDSGKGLSGNRIIPIGSKYIHCVPPSGYREDKVVYIVETPAMDMEPVRLRARSNSAESWEAVNGGTTRRGVRHTWQTEPDDPEGETRNSKAKRQDSYLQAVRNHLDRESHVGQQHETANEAPKPTELNSVFPAALSEAIARTTASTMPTVTISPPPPVRPNQLPIPNPLRPLDTSFNHQHLPSDQQNVDDPESTGSSLAPGSDSPANEVVLRRQKNSQLSDEERATRRVSYLKATWGERMHVDSDLELSDTESVVQAIRSNSIANTHSNTTCSAGTPKDVEPVEREGSLHVKFTVLDGKRSTDRSWKQVWGVLRGPILYFYKDRHTQSPSATSDSDVGQHVDVRCSLVDVADDYTKRKHVFRVANTSAEVLLQTDDAASMALWLRALHKHAAAEKTLDGNSSTTKQQAVPQTPGPTTPSGSPAGGQRLSPLPGHKGIRKLTSFRNRSPTGQSPVNKTRKPSQTVEPLQSPKSKTWKGRVAKQLRKMHGQAGSPSSPTAQLQPEGATFKVPLELCPVSSFSEFVPLIVEMCTSIVEARGLEVIGIYRVPGNTAAISQLTESVNKGFENINLQDPRWSDVNVISSLLKSFFRQLPDSLLTAELYPMFIDADKIEDPQRRMATIRKLLRDLPEHHFETLKYLMFHLKKVVEHSEINKMEAKNLAIVFGPTLVRASGSRDNMVTMVTDMSHQCRIVESLLNNVDWFFCEEDLDDLSRLSVNLSLPADGSEAETTTNHNLLLNNIQKVEGMREMVSAKDIVSSIISAANRKIQRRRKGQEEQESEDHEDEKTKAKQDESLGVIRQSMALNERQCSVSEMVLMHETKSQPTHTNDNTVISSANSSPQNSSSMSSRSKYPGSPSTQHQQQEQQQQQQQSQLSTTLSLDSSRLSCDIGSGSLDTVSTISNLSNDTKQSNDEVAIRTYAGLSATTQERIRRFEQETKAMLQRDQHRQRREAEKREEERRRIEMEWQLAKREMENDDILDGIIDNAVGAPYLTDRLSNLNDRLAERSSGDSGADTHRSKSTTRLTPLSLTVQQQPTARQKALATNQLTSLIGKKINNGIVKKFKTDKESSMESLAPTRYGSLDSLHEVHTSPSPSHQTRGIPGDISDDAGSCFLHWTQKILTINRKLVRHTATPSFWCYISSHLHGSAGASSASTKTPAPQPPEPRTATDPSTTTCSAASSSSSPPLQLSEPRVSESGLGAGPSSKTLNKFLRGSDLLTSLTSTFDRKWKSLVNPSNLLVSSTENNSTGTANSYNKQSNYNDNDCNQSTRSPEVYRDPSLHKAHIDKNILVRTKTDTLLEKEKNLTVAEITKKSKGELSRPDNDRNVHRKTSEISTTATDSSDGGSLLDATEKDENPSKIPIKSKRFETKNKSQENESASNSQHNDEAKSISQNDSNNLQSEDKTIMDSSYSNKLEKFESLSSQANESRSRLKRSESLNKRTEIASSKLKRSESLNKHSDRLASPTNGKLKRSESLNKHAERSESPNMKLKRSESLTKTEKTECNISKRRQSVRKESATKLKRKNGMPERSIKRRHTVGGTKDFDKVHWLDNKLQSETERIIKNDNKPKKSQLRTSSPDLSSNRVNVADTSFLIEVSFRGPSNVVFNVTNARPQSLPDANLASKVFKVPLESHV